MNFAKKAYKPISSTPGCFWEFKWLYWRKKNMITQIWCARSMSSTVSILHFIIPTNDNDSALLRWQDCPFGTLGAADCGLIGRSGPIDARQMLRWGPAGMARKVVWRCSCQQIDLFCSVSDTSGTWVPPPDLPDPAPAIFLNWKGQFLPLKNACHFSGKKFNLCRGVWTTGVELLPDFFFQIILRGFCVQ